MKFCLPCQEKRGLDVPATTADGLCDRCQDQANEDAHERFIEAFYGGSAPVSDRERFELEDGRRW